MFLLRNEIAMSSWTYFLSSLQFRSVIRSAGSKGRPVDYFFFCHARIIAPAHVSPLAICAIDWLSCAATIQTGVSFFFLTGVQLVDEPSGPLHHYFVFLGKLGHSGLHSHGFESLCERSLTF